MSGEVSGIGAQGALSAQLIRIQTEQPGAVASQPTQSTESSPPPPPTETGRGLSVDRVV